MTRERDSQPCALACMGFMNVIVANASALKAMEANTTQYLRSMYKISANMELHCTPARPKAEGIQNAVSAWSKQEQFPQHAHMRSGNMSTALAKRLWLRKMQVHCMEEQLT